MFSELRRILIYSQRLSLAPSAYLCSRVQDRECSIVFTISIDKGKAGGHAAVIMK